MGMIGGGPVWLIRFVSGVPLYPAGKPIGGGWPPAIGIGGRPGGMCAETVFGGRLGLICGVVACEATFAMMCGGIVPATAANELTSDGGSFLGMSNARNFRLINLQAMLNSFMSILPS